MKKELDIILKKYGKEAVMVLKREMRIDRTVASGQTLNSIAIARSIAAKGTIKRFGYGGSDVLSRIEQGSQTMRGLDEDISELLDDKIQLIFKQL